MEAIFEAIRSDYKKNHSLYNLSRKFKISIQEIRRNLEQHRLIPYHLEQFCKQNRGKKIFLFDLETTGLPIRKGFDEYYPYTSNKHYESARIVQLAYCIFVVGQTSTPVIVNYFRKPEQFTVSSEASNIHGLTQEFLIKNGVSFQTIINSGLVNEIAECDIIMSHNTGFDVNILCNELYRMGVQIPNNLLNNQTVCSCKLTNWTKLEVLYKLVVPTIDPNLHFHNARDDVLALYQIIRHLS
jgi:DNA polymerase III epsilon subunit-like protein